MSGNTLSVGAKKIVKALIISKTTISAMESCTGGLFASTITDCSGASEIFPGSYVTYGNEAKIRAGVPKETIDTYGVYSVETAEAMAFACSNSFKTDIGVGVTGSLGRKDPANPDSVVGEVYFSIYCNGQYESRFLVIPASCTTRCKMKKYVVGEIFKTLTSLL